MLRVTRLFAFSLGLCCVVASLEGAEAARLKGISAVAAQGSHPLTLEEGSDNGFLACAAQVLSLDFRHNNTNEVFANLATKPDSSAVAVIAGHGGAGFECTGLGNHCGGRGGPILASGNDAVLAPLAKNIASSFREVDLLACDVGAERRGAELLYKLAMSVKMPVAAPTTLVWCGSGKIWIDPPEIWQRATPDQMPKVIHKPKVTVLPQTLLQFRAGLSMIHSSISDVRIEAFEVFGVTGSGSYKFGGRLGPEIVSLIDFAQPLEPGGVPSAIATGEISLQVRNGGRVIEKHFVIYNDEIAQDKDYPQIFYRVDSRLSEMLVNSR